MPFNRTAAMRKLHSVAKTRGLDHEAIRDIATSLFRLPQDKQSIAALNNIQLGQLLTHIQNPGSVAITTVQGGPTHRQIWLIKRLATELDWDSNPERLAGFIARQAKGKTHLANCTVYEAGKIIEGLKQLLAQGN
jgi:hypothetical protein